MKWVVTFKIQFFTKEIEMRFTLIWVLISFFSILFYKGILTSTFPKKIKYSRNGKNTSVVLFLSLKNYGSSTLGIIRVFVAILFPKPHMAIINLPMQLISNQYQIYLAAWPNLISKSYILISTSIIFPRSCIEHNILVGMILIQCFP
jgi:hypothetical protein